MINHAIRNYKPILFIIVPCYNEEEVLTISADIFLNKMEELIKDNIISSKSKIMFVNDGSKDNTWKIINQLSKKSEHYIGISQSRNRGHQNAVLAGLMESKDMCDITISIDCDGQDDINVMGSMVEEYLNGNEIVYGVRSQRITDTFFKRFTAESFYKMLDYMDVEVINNHSDYRLISSRVLQELAKFKEVNLFLRGLIPLVGFKSTKVYYERHERIAGKTHYPFKKMLSLAIDGITSFSIKPVRLITIVGCFFSIVSIVCIIWNMTTKSVGVANINQPLIICVICFFGGLQLTSLGIIGEYIGKIYLETKARPRYIISERTYTK